MSDDHKAVGSEVALPRRARARVESTADSDRFPSKGGASRPEDDATPCSQSGGASGRNLLRRRTPQDFLSGESAGSSPRMAFDSKSFVPQRVGSDIGARYDIDLQEVIGSGGCGKVYLAKDRMFKNRLVAVKKVLKPSAAMTAAFHLEVDIMKHLDHPGICRLFESYESGLTMCFVIEYCEGGDLYDRFSEVAGTIPENLVADIVRQIAGALNYAHGRGIAHRDLKLENICFCSRDPAETQVKVIDWGLGKYFGEGKMKSSVGSTAYAAPEVLDRSTFDADGYTSACDFWSLAVVAYVSLSGKPPFWGGPKEQLRRMQEERYPLDGGIWTGISLGAKDFIRQLLRHNPRDRMEARQVLQHPWLLSSRRPVEPSLLKRVLTNAEQFSRAPDFLSFCVASVARQVDHASLTGIREVFDFLDTNGDGVLDLQEVQSGFRAAFGADCGPGDVEEMFFALDLDGSRGITYTEFCAAGMGEGCYTQEHVLWAAFKTFDLRDDGRISPDEMQQVLENADVKKVWTKSLCEEVAREVMDEFGGTDGNIDFQDWVSLMHQCASRREAEPSKLQDVVAAEAKTSRVDPAAEERPKPSSSSAGRESGGCMQGLASCTVF